MAADQRLTEKQRKFCREYVRNGGNANLAAKEAGYAFPAVDGCRTLDSVNIQAYIKELSKSQLRSEKRSIADARERQEFWSDVMRGIIKDVDMVDGVPVERPPRLSDRLKAAETLGKSQLDFSSNVNVSLDATGELLAAIRGSALRPGTVATVLRSIDASQTDDISSSDDEPEED